MAVWAGWKKSNILSLLPGPVQSRHSGRLAPKGCADSHIGVVPNKREHHQYHTTAKG